jgi:hypothetical protein
MATLLGERLGVAHAPSLREPGGWDLWLGAELLEVVPWRCERAGDNPAGEGRLVFEPIIPGDLPANMPADAEPGVADDQLVAVIWATVDLERAEADLAPWLEPLAMSEPPPALVDEPHLGARGRVRTTSALPGGRIVLLEPVTEGAVAASLARDGEGPCGLYVRGAPGAAAVATEPRLRSRPGPFGPSVRLRTTVKAGPHLLLLSPGTIGP